MSEANVTATSPAVPGHGPPEGGDGPPLLPLPVLLHNAYAASSGAAPGLLLPASVLSLIGIVAVLFNGSILFVTLRSKSSLRGSCIYLLALLSVLEVFHAASHFPFLVVATLGQNFIGITGCMRIQLLPIFAVQAIQSALTSIAIDRLLSAVTPIFYKRIQEQSTNRHVYLAVLTTFTLGFGLVSVGYVFMVIRQYSGLNVTCDIADIVNLPAVNLVFAISVYGLSGLSILFYAVVWLSIRKNIANSDTQTRLFKSLVTIICVNIGGYLVNIFFIGLYIAQLQQHFTLMWALVNVNASLLNACAAANGPILYFMSADYRKAYQHHLFTARWLTSTTTANNSKNPNGLFVRRNNAAALSISALQQNTAIATNVAPKQKRQQQQQNIALEMRK